MTIRVDDGWSGEDSMPAAEQMALTSFARYLEAYISVNITEKKVQDENVLEEAELLMSLLSSKPPSPPLEQYPYDNRYEPTGLIHPDTFSFTCPLLSLDCSISPNGTKGGRAATVQEVASPAALLLARRTTLDDPEKLRSTAEAISRNVQESFHKAVEWRIQQWIHSLSCVLLRRERELLRQHASEETLREILHTPEAKVLLCLRTAASEIKVIDTSTCFRVLPQRFNRNHGSNQSPSDRTPPLKKRKVELPASLQTETEYKYTVTHVLTFEAVLNLSTPAGYTEIMIEAPGIMEGTFLSSDMGEDILTGVSVEIDTHVFAEAIERSSRIVARAATHAIIPTPPQDDQYFATKEDDNKGTHAAAPSPTQDEGTPIDNAAIVTPCKKVSTYEFPDDKKDVYVPIPDDLDNSDPIRMVSPQPQSGAEYKSFSFGRRTPTATTNKMMMAMPTLVSPKPPSSAASSGSNEESPTLEARKSPSLPALLQVASAAMYAC